MIGPPCRRAIAALFVLAAARCAAPAAAWAAPKAPSMTESVVVFTDRESRLSIEATGWLGLADIASDGDRGAVPVTIRIVNGSDHDVTVAVEPRAGTVTAVLPSVVIAAPAGSTTTETVHVEAMPSAGGRLGSISGAFVGSLRAAHSGGGSRHVVELSVGETYVSAAPGAPSSGIPRMAATATALERLASAIGDGDAPRLSTLDTIDLAAAPEDWRGWSALREVVISDDEWERLPAVTRQAMFQWLALGGVLRVVAEDLDPARLDRIGLPEPGADDVRRVGAGEVIPIPLDDVSLRHVVSQGWFVDGGDGWRDPRPLHPWLPDALAAAGGFSARTFPLNAILAFLVLFALAAGPANVILAARGGRPARVFWTTPLLSLAAAAVLTAIMLLGDGVGGAGVRRTLCLIDPARSSAGVLQEQFSRTGVLFGGSFPVRERSRMRPEPTIAGGLSSTKGVVEGRRFTDAPGQRRGDWFRSRSDQAFSLAAIRPHRGRLDWSGGESPAIESSIDAAIDRVIVRDERGRLWRGGQTEAGRTTALEPATEDELNSMLATLAPDQTGAVAMAVARLRDAPGLAWAEAASPARLAIATHGAIRWRDDRAWFVIPVGRRDQP